MWASQVVYDLRKGEEELATISPWLLNIQARAPSSPILVVGTHRDLIGTDHKSCDMLCMYCIVLSLVGKFQDAKRAMRSKILGLTDRPGT